MIFWLKFYHDGQWGMGSRFSCWTTLQVCVRFHILRFTTVIFWVSDEVNAPEGATGAVRLSRLEVMIQGRRRGWDHITSAANNWIGKLLFLSQVDRNRIMLQTVSQRKSTFSTNQMAGFGTYSFQGTNASFVRFTSAHYLCHLPFIILGYGKMHLCGETHYELGILEGFRRKNVPLVSYHASSSLVTRPELR